MIRLNWVLRSVCLSADVRIHDRFDVQRMTIASYRSIILTAVLVCAHGIYQGVCGEFEVQAACNVDEGATEMLLFFSVHIVEPDKGLHTVFSED